MTKIKKQKELPKPNRLINSIWKYFSKDSNILDLGCGMGNDAIFLSAKNFSVTCIDKSVKTIKEIKKLAKNYNLKITTLSGDICNYNFKSNHFDVIICQNVLQFFPKNKSLRIINKIISNIKVGGYIIISSFTIDDPSFKKEKKLASYFNLEELKKLFADLEIKYYFEGIIVDPAHPGVERPHQHGVVKIVAQKTP